jgi:hypothetical protein
MMILQISRDILKVEPGLYRETCVSSSHDGYEATDVKVEQISYIEEDENPVPIMFPAVKAEREVSLCWCVHCWAHFTDIQNCFFVLIISTCLALYIK